MVHDAENDNVKSPKEGKNLMKITGDDTLGYRILGVKQEKGLSANVRSGRVRNLARSALNFATWKKVRRVLAAAVEINVISY